MAGALRGGRLACGVLAAGCALAASASAAESEGRWYVGGSLSYLSTFDDIRSNAAISIGTLGEDGVPFTFDPGEVNGCTAPGTFCDPRPDHLLNSPTEIEETFQYNLHAGVALASWLSLQLDATYFKGSVGPVDAYLSDHFPRQVNPNDDTSLLFFQDRDIRFPLHAGEITEIPVALSLLTRFRTKSWVKPYLGVGVGKIYADIDGGDELEAFTERVSKMRVRAIADQFGNDITPSRFSVFNPLTDARVPLEGGIRIELPDLFEYHLAGGFELLASSRIGVVLDARYTFADGGIRFDVGGHDQVDLLTWSEAIYRPDGTVRIFSSEPEAPNPLCFDNEFRGLGCDQEHMEPGDARVDPEAEGPLGVPRFTCPAAGDFDRNGSVDVCYDKDTIFPSPKGFKESRGDVVIQGGKIDLSGFSVALGLRFHF